MFSIVFLLSAAGVSVPARTVPLAVQQRSRSAGRRLLGSVLPLRRTQRKDPGSDRLRSLQETCRTAHVSLYLLLNLWFFQQVTVVRYGT